MNWTASLLVMLAATSAQPVLDPGRCGGEYAEVRISPGSHTDVVATYVQCLVGAEQKYGFNDGPYAVSQCLKEKQRVLDRLPPDTRSTVREQIEEVDRQFVWMTWCSTDVGSEIQTSIEIRPEWPQAKGVGG
jgi:hypothetical protein